MLIKDGTGKGYSAKVDSEYRLYTRSVVNTAIIHANEHEGLSFMWRFPGYDYDANDTLMYLQNTSSTYHLHIHEIYVYSDTTTTVHLHFPTAPTTPSGTLVTGVNLNRASANIAEAVAYQDETANTQGTILASCYLTANTPIRLFDTCECEIILGLNDCLAVDLVTAGTMAYGQISGYYHVEV